MQYRSFIIYIALVALLCIAAQCNKNGNPASPTGGGNNNNITQLNANAWLTRGDQSVLLQQQNGWVNAPAQTNQTITVDESARYQAVDGFGYTLTGGSAQLLNALDETIKNDLLTELFGNGSGSIGVSYLRLSIGASDLDASVFSYNDLPAGQTDIDQDHFSIAKDKENLIPVLKKILAINPALKIIAAPWSPPVWMKDNGSSIGGSLKPEYYDSYAKYLVKYIQAMKAEGIAIDAITPQNEPLHPGNNPSLYMTAEQQRDFIKNNLGPAFKAADITTKIVIYDHNLDRPDYPETILNDPGAAKYIDGTAFHLYAGDVNTMATIHNKFPSKNLYFTEQWTGATGSFDGDLLWHVKNVIIGTMRNWSRLALEWNLASDPQYNPHTPGGCTECKGALTVKGNNISRNVSYYIIAHASKFVPPGSVRIGSNDISGVSNVAFITPEGKKVLIVANDNVTAYAFNIRYKDSQGSVNMPAKSAATIVW